MRQTFANGVWAFGGFAVAILNFLLYVQETNPEKALGFALVAGASSVTCSLAVASEILSRREDKRKRRNT